MKRIFLHYSKKLLVLFLVCFICIKAVVVPLSKYASSLAKEKIINTLDKQPQKASIYKKTNTSKPKKKTVVKQKVKIINKANRQTTAGNIVVSQTVDKATAVPADVLSYTVTINNATTDNATGVVFSNSIDPNTTLVAASVKATPIAIDDAYNCIGNVGMNVNTAMGSLLNNDISPDGTSLTVTILANPIHGVAALATDGKFTYNPTAGYSGPDNFTYTVTSSNGKQILLQ